MAIKGHTPPFIANDVNLSWPIFYYDFQLMPGTEDLDEMQFTMQENGCLQVVTLNETEAPYIVSVQELEEAGCGGMACPLTLQNIEQLKKAMREDDAKK